eukprot:TRINITY_DN2329_c1_g1_i1.p1 TRINITY_DN2329_c1_g1~~TRINITY_DN2329_c1_g1_i1.p1  ORF type:complete len:597 (-),score=167.99 TRINITY_DN2329_c1_g1_i1:79-1692(-)
MACAEALAHRAYCARAVLAQVAGVQPDNDVGDDSVYGDEKEEDGKSVTSAGLREAEEWFTSIYLLELLRERAARNPKCLLRALAFAADLREGTAEEQFVCGWLFYVHGDLPDSFAAWKHSADAGNSCAMNSLAFSLLHGKGIAQPDKAAAVEYYERATALHHVTATGNLAFCVECAEGTFRDYGRAILLYRKAAGRGDLFAMNRLGMIYKRGDGVQRDDLTALRLVGQAARAGDPHALNNLAAFYKKRELPEAVLAGREMSDLHRIAFRLYQRSAAKGNADAMSFMGLCYEKGEGVDRDLDKAVELFHKAAENSDVWAYNHLGTLFQNGLGADGDSSGHIAKDPVRAVAFFTKCADMGGSNAMVNLALCLQKGIGCEHDDRRAVELLTQAVELGNIDAMSFLAMCYENGNSHAPRNLTKAMSLFARASAAGDLWATNHCGIIYAEGLPEGNPQENRRLACSFFTDGFDKGDASCTTNLGKCYLLCIGVQKDTRSALKLLRLGVDRGDAHAQTVIDTLREIPPPSPRGAELAPATAET